MNDGHFGCLNYYKLDQTQKEDQNCELLAKKLLLSLYTFKAINNDLDCEVSLTNIEYVCSSGVSPKCSKYYSVKQNDTVSNILKTYELNMSDFSAANPLINIDLIYPTQILCLEKIEFDTVLNLQHPSLNKLVMEIGVSEKSVLSSINDFINNPIQSNAENLNGILKDSVIKNKEVKTIFKNFETTEYGKQKIIAKGYNNLCALVDKTHYPLSSQCFCSNNEPIVYCMVVFTNENKLNMLKKASSFNVDKTKSNVKN